MLRSHGTELIGEPGNTTRWSLILASRQGAATRREALEALFTTSAVLQAWRISRPLHRESRLWLGLTLALCPPVVELGRYLLAWRP